MSEPVSLHEEEVLGKAYDARLIRRLLGYLGPYRLRAAGAVGLIVLSSLLELVGPLATAVALDLFIRPLGGEAKLTGLSLWLSERLARGGIELEPMRGLAIVAGVYLGALLAGFVVLYLQSYLMQMMGQYVMADLRRQIFAKLQKLPVAYFDRNPVGRLVTRVTNDVDALNELFTAGIVSIFGDVMLLAGIVAVLFWLDWRLALVTFCILPLLAALTLWFKVRARQRYREVRLKLAAINSFLQEQITGMSVIQLFNQERRTFDDFTGINDEYRVANVATIFYYAVYYPAVELVTALGVALILWYGGGQVLRGALSVGALVAFLQYAQRFYRPLSDLSEKYNILQAAMASSERIFGLLDSPVEIASPARAHRPAAVRGGVEFERVSFGYLAGETVLDEVSFRVEPGQTVALVGHTGAGKSTVASLLLRFYDVDRGRVLVDGVDVRDWESELAAAGHRHGAPGRLPVRRHGGRQHRPGQRRDRRRPHPPRGARGARARLHRAPAGRLRQRDPRARRRAVGRPEAAHRLRPRPGLRPAHPDPRRGDLVGGHRDRAAHPAGPRPPARRPHQPGHRPPAVDDPTRRPHPGPAPGSAARAGHPPGAAGRGRAVPAALRAAVPG